MAEKVGEIYYVVEADTASLIEAERKVAASVRAMQKELGGAGTASREASFKMKEYSKSIQEMGRTTSGVIPILGSFYKLIAAAAVLKTAKEVVRLADAWQSLENRLRLVTDSNKELEQAVDDVFKIAQGTSQEIDTIAQVYQRFAQNADTLGLSLLDVAEVTDVVAKAVAVSGASAASAEAALVQFGQALASGVLRGEELNSVMEQTPALAQAIAHGMGIAVGDLRTVAADGKITAEVLIEALKKAGDSVETQFNTRVKTAAQAWVEMQNSITRFVGQLSSGTAMTSQLADAISSISAAIDNVDLDRMSQELEGIKAIIALVIDGAKGIYGAFKEYFPAAAEAVGLSMTDVALGVAKTADGITETFTGTVGAIQGLWQALAHNIPAFFDNAWITIQSGAARLVNFLADILNKPLEAIGASTFDKVSFGAAASTEIKSLTDAAVQGWNEAEQGLGAYEKTLKRVTDRMINNSIAQWQEEYSETADKASESINTLAKETDSKAKVDKKAANAAEQNRKAIAALEQAVQFATLSGIELAEAKAAASLNEFATEPEIERIKGLGRQLYEINKLEQERQKFGQGKQAEEYIMGNVSPLSGGLFDGQYARYEAEAEAEQKRYEEQLERLREARELQIETNRSYDDMELEAAQQHADRMAQIEQAKHSVLLSSAKDAFSVMAGVMKQAHGEQSNTYKAMFAAAKAFAVADATINAYGAISKAWNSAPFPANLGAVAATTPQVMSVVSAVSGASYGGGRQYGGPVSAGKMYRVNENGKPEVYNAANGQQYLLPNRRGQVVSNSEAQNSKGQDGPKIIINIHNAPEGTRAEAQQIDDAYIVNVVVADLAQEGSISKAGGAHFGWRRQGR